MRSSINVTEVLLVVDAMTGQDAVNVAQQFNEALEIDGVIMTKLDGDARGGAALSIKTVTGKPIKFVGTSEKMDGLEPFHPGPDGVENPGDGGRAQPDRKGAAVHRRGSGSRDGAQVQGEYFRPERLPAAARADEEDGAAGSDSGDDSRAGELETLKDAKIDEKEFAQVEAILRSMTNEERGDPSILNASRRRRIAAGSGTHVQDVNELMNQFREMKKMIRAMTGAEESGKKRKRLPDFPFMR